MKVSFKDMADGIAVLSSSGKIEFDISLRIYDHRFAVGSEHVRGMRQTPQVELLKIHRSPAPLLSDARTKQIVLPRGHEGASECGRSSLGYEGSGVMNSRPKQKPLRERTIAGSRECTGVSNSTSSKSPGFRRIPA